MAHTRPPGRVRGAGIRVGGHGGCFDARRGRRGLASRDGVRCCLRRHRVGVVDAGPAAVGPRTSAARRSRRGGGPGPAGGRSARLVGGSQRTAATLRPRRSANVSLDSSPNLVCTPRPTDPDTTSIELAGAEEAARARRACPSRTSTSTSTPTFGPLRAQPGSPTSPQLTLSRAAENCRRHHTTFRKLAPSRERLAPAAATHVRGQLARPYRHRRASAPRACVLESRGRWCGCRLRPLRTQAINAIFLACEAVVRTLPMLVLSPQYQPGVNDGPKLALAHFP
jgi:hypothetical protein